MKKQNLIVLAVLVIGAAGVFAILRSPPPAATDTHEHADEASHEGEAAHEHEGEAGHAHEDSAGAAGGDATHDHPEEAGEHVEIEPQAAADAGITITRAGPAQISESLALYGSVVPDERRVRSVGARFPGVVREVRANLGERIERGATLALVESNESLETYPVRAPIGGIVLARDANPGENAGDEPLFTVADLSVLWAELTVFRRDLARVRMGQTVRVRADDGSVEGEGRIGFIAPTGSGESQSVRLRVELDNRDGRWQPGAFVTGEVSVTAKEVPLAVRRSALQKYEGADVVFAVNGTRYAPRTLELGSADAQHAEVKSGLAAGESYVATGSFLVKAELGKAGAGHDH